MKYWVYINNQILGPYEKEQFSQVPGFTPETMVCPENPPDGKQEWQPAMSVTGSAAPAAQPAPAQPAPAQSEVPAPLQMASAPAPAPIASSVDPVSLGALGRKNFADAAVVPSSDALAALESSIKAQSSEIRSLEHKLDDFAASIKAMQSELASLKVSRQPAQTPLPSSVPAQSSVPVMMAPAPEQPEPMFSQQPQSAPVPQFSVPASSVPHEHPQSSASEQPVVSKKKSGSKAKVFLVLLVIAGIGGYFAYSSGMLNKPAPAPEREPAPVVAVSTAPVVAQPAVVSDEMMAQIKAYEVLPARTLESVIAASAPEVAPSSITWSGQLLDPSLCSVAVRVPPSTPDGWQISYRFDYNVPEKKLVPANNEATELLEKLKAESAAPPVETPKAAPKPRKRAAKKPAAASVKQPASTSKPAAAGDVVEVIEVVEQ